MKRLEYIKRVFPADILQCHSIRLSICRHFIIVAAHYCVNQSVPNPIYCLIYGGISVSFYPRTDTFYPRTDLEQRTMIESPKSIIIDPSALDQNVSQMKKLIGPKTKWRVRAKS